MNKSEALTLMKDKGFVFDDANFGVHYTKFIDKENMPKTVQDAAITAANSGVPAIYTTFIDPMIVEILTAPINARKIFGEVKKGDWTTHSAMFRTVEAMGETTVYSDYGNGAMADVNITWPQRDNFIGQTHITYGQREMAVTGKAAIQLASEKQKSAALTIDKAMNKINLYGVEGKNIYGLLNDPNIPDALTPASIGGVTLWKNKTTQQVYEDILTMAAKLFEKSQGLLDESSPLVLAIPPELNVVLGKATDFNINVKKMLNDYFSSIEFVTLPELKGESMNTVILTAKEIEGQPVAQFGFSEKMRAFPLIPSTSSFTQKFCYGSYGCIIFRPFAICMMEGC